MLLAEKLAYLEQESTFSDTEFTAEKNKRAFYKTSAEDSVQLSDTCIIADVAVCADVLKLEDIIRKIGSRT